MEQQRDLISTLLIYSALNTLYKSQSTSQFMSFNAFGEAILLLVVVM